MKKGPWRITFDTNPDDCNLHCIMCEEHSVYSLCQVNRKKEGRPRRRMDIQLIRKILQEAQGSPLKEIIPSTMGEPLLFKQFEDVVDMCREFNVKMNLTTNGTFPKYGATKWAEKIVPVGSDVKISWNGATKETSEKIMVGSSFEKRLQNVKDFIAVRDRVANEGGNFCRVTFQLTFMEISLNELVDTIKLAASIGVNRIKGHHLWVFTQEMISQSLRKDAISIKKWNKVAQEAIETAKNLRLPNGDPILLENIYPLEESAIDELIVEGVCPFLGKEAWVSAEGRFNPCCAPDKDRKTLGDFGFMYDQSMENVFNSEKYQNLIHQYMHYPICRKCNMRKKQEDVDCQTQKMAGSQSSSK
ncbi:MAG: 7-carboxy-7-deazaguanine synthase [Chlamydiae bacterium]|nr:7-carboxy-7-deazaguanine synthase [Chlamydiota bacterium]